ncbi:hypothetical protein AM587_10012513 [Phytophthora nicotianae]|uniref:Uncharacterized protein n=1 Tax=Phytophthora nicotianae TaxID=4792 RepID=A0A0W8CJY7_PHYNI|nr:hypothetical protein AM587_10012513 [Phytophthora nicotianae]
MEQTDNHEHITAIRGRTSPKETKAGGEDIRYGTLSHLLAVEEHKLLLKLDEAFPAWREGPAHYGGKWASIESEMQTRFPGFSVKRQKLQSICSRGRSKRKLRQLQNQLKMLDLDAKDIGNVKTKESDAKEATQEVQSLQATVKKLEEQCAVEVAARKAARAEAESWKTKALQADQAKKDTEEEKVFLTKEFQHLMAQYEALKAREKKRVAALKKQLETERAVNTELLRDEEDERVSNAELHRDEEGKQEDDAEN